MTNPYHIEGPALVSFSGGRTSAFMLWHILDAFDGNLPEDVHVCFANTGKEREETLRFVLEGREILVHQERERPGYLGWWIEAERTPRGQTDKPKMAQFNKSFSYVELRRQAESSELLIPIDWRNLEFDAECGVSGTDTQIRCGARTAA